MKNPILILLVALLAIVVSPTQTTALTVEDQPCVELLSTVDMEVVVSADITLAPVSAFAIKTIYPDCAFSMAPVADIESQVVVTHPIERASQYPIRDFKPPQLNCAAFGAVLLTVVDSEVLQETSDGIIGFIWNNKLIIIGFLLGLSEVLALIPGISQNGIFQAIFQLLKKLKSKQTSA